MDAPALVPVVTATDPVVAVAVVEDDAVQAAKLMPETRVRKTATPAMIDIRVERFMPRYPTVAALSPDRITAAPPKSLR